MHIQTPREALKAGMPPPKGLVLVRVESVGRGSPARQKMRTVILEIARCWLSDRFASQSVCLLETASGPRLVAGSGACPLEISLSYDGVDGWICFGNARAVGCDAVRIEMFAEMEAVVTLYLGGERGDRVRHATDPARAFAESWSAWEASRKRQRLATQINADSTSCLHVDARSAALQQRAHETRLA